jgi:pectin methylesterase-like acyl-CoA thioesterase
MRDSRPVPLCVLVLALVVGGCRFPARTIAVPADTGTVNTPARTIKVSAGQSIQAAIDAAVKGDVVLVAKGIYRENIDFRGKAITVRSTKPADRGVVAATVIDPLGISEPATGKHSPT